MQEAILLPQQKAADSVPAESALTEPVLLEQEKKNVRPDDAEKNHWIGWAFSLPYSSVHQAMIAKRAKQQPCQLFHAWLFQINLALEESSLLPQKKVFRQ